jgi:superfamily II DNA/RNA helicase
LLDLGFEKKMEEIVGILDKRLEDARTGPRQTALFSATMHSNLGKLATLSLRNPVAVGFRCDHLEMTGV